MEIFRNAAERALNYLSTIGIADILDILIVAYLIYRVIILVRRTNTYNLARGLIVFLVVLWISGMAKLTMINYILRRAFEIGAIALLILFQPELRKFLERMGRTFSQGRVASSSEIESVIMQTIIACNDLSASKTGALIIFERKVKLDDIIASGTIINSDVNAELLKNLFFNKAPLHDGAVIIRDGRIAAAGCVLPLTKSTNLSKDLGMRHRAGIGMSEQSDALVVIVSEETGAISVAEDGMLKRHLNSSTFDKILHSELVLDESESNKSIWKAIKKLLTVEKDEQEKQIDEKNN
ncbi:MAG: diadenylate cyclase CdaA [Oscillospiraceae bacterium]|nr:diadenylate cyclase CdaA [Oscillospiraceae bacterium]